jgi:thioredoxin-dependent peroxiredoxin
MTEQTIAELREGELAPDFTALTDAGTELTLSDLRGQRVVLFFYPKDDTPGCTIESCEFRDAHPRLVAQHAVVLGVSPDDVRSHQKFRKKFDLPFTLIVDEGHRIADQYGTWGPKSLFGVKYTGTLRTTFVLDREGRIARIFRNVKPKGHAEEVEEALAAIP